jgi:sortase A
MVRGGIDLKTLKLAVGQIPATARPGQPGMVGVAGHRDTFFRELKNLKTGDEIQFSTLSGDFQYVVESLIVVDSDNAAALAPTSESVLTMVTCYPFYYVGAAPKRFVARARQVSPLTLARSSVK